MVTEVENILNEIRERVRTEHEQETVPVTIVKDETAKDLAPNANNESLSRLAAHVTTTARAWDRLPPLYSNRKGGAARFELWIKGRLKSMSRWFTWEQVNFNSAVHHSLSETLHALSAYQQEQLGIRRELHKESESWRERFERSDREVTSLRTSIEALTNEIRKRAADQDAHNTAMDDRSKNMETRTGGLEAHTGGLEARTGGLEARTGGLEARTGGLEARTTELTAAITRELDETRAEVTSRLAILASELRESDQQLREEQRVCFKQLSLEASETAVSEDRGRRVIESRLDKLEKTTSNVTE